MTKTMRLCDAVGNIRNTCERVVKEAKFVSIDDNAIDLLAEDLIKRELVQVGKAFSGVEWGSCGKFNNIL